MSTPIETSARKRSTSLAIAPNMHASPLPEVSTLAWRIKARLDKNDGMGQIVAVTSCCRKAGVSTLVSNLAYCAVGDQLGPVLVIDANMAAPFQHQIFGSDAKIGLVDVMLGTMAPDECVVSTNVPSLDVMPLGLASRLNLARVISNYCDEMLAWARNHYETILVDLPQIDDLRHGLMIARKADMTLIAIRANAVRYAHAAKNIERLVQDGVTVSGTILTRQTIRTPRILRS
jgi:polysaccharide biosynthesis transport protein